MTQKITKSAAESLASGVCQEVFRKSSAGQTCQSGYALCANGRVVATRIDWSEPMDRRITWAKSAGMSWATAVSIAANS